MLQSSLPTPKIPEEFGGYIDFFRTPIYPFNDLAENGDGPNFIGPLNKEYLGKVPLKEDFFSILLVGVDENRGQPGEKRRKLYFPAGVGLAASGAGAALEARIVSRFAFNSLALSIICLLTFFSRNSSLASRKAKALAFNNMVSVR